MSSLAPYLHLLLKSVGGEPSALRKLLLQNNDAENLWRSRGGNPDEAEREMESLERDGIHLLDLEDAAYPPLLKEIHEPPLLLYIRGTLPDYSSLFLGIVGTRKPTEYGKRVASSFGAELARKNTVIISGCAYGIDETAHRGVVEEKGLGIAVVGSGLDENSFYPRSNFQLAQTLVSLGGAAISEYPPGTAALPHHFPERNRIIVGLAKGILFVEAMERSGTQITARLAAEENRDVFAIPGSIYSLASLGPNRLIKDGAIPVLAPSEILEFYGIENTREVRTNETMSDLEHTLCELLTEPLSLDELKERTAAEITALQSALSLLELRGVIAEVDSGTYAVIRG